MKKLLFIVSVFCIIFSFNCFAYDYNGQSSVIYNGNSSFSENFYNSRYANNYIVEYNNTIQRTPAFIKPIRVDDGNGNIVNVTEPQYIIGGPIILTNGSIYEIILNDSTNQLWNRVKFHYSLTKSLLSNFDAMDIKLNGVSIAKENWNKLNSEDDYYIWIYKPGNITITFSSTDLLNGGIGKSILTITGIETYNG